MPKHHKHHKPSPPRHRHVPSSAVSAFIDEAALGARLAPWVPDEAARDFLVRCVVREGPAHHRGANYVLLALLSEVAQRVGAQPPTGETLPTSLRLPPHLERDVEEPTGPLGIPTAALERLAASGSRDYDAMVDCLTDGPPQHAVANVTMVSLLESILQALERRKP